MEHPVVQCFIVKTYYFSLFIIIYKFSKLLTLIEAINCNCCLQIPSRVSPVNVIEARRRSLDVSPLILSSVIDCEGLTRQLRHFSLPTENSAHYIEEQVGPETFWTYWRMETPLSLPGSKSRTVQPVLRYTAYAVTTADGCKGFSTVTVG
jgi:hypothetical protein